ncbi:hypothetical protein [Phreatobacter stygius]|uniref:Uncharacterized protein n=1 Tax=Phreatobacter stygius TaxID=1940610 RepID=A0A4D7BEC3_9HYPH|nr:hypothetical protein [Phreatobacter stygius]QCI68905.1 hypothetical protein E8M01_34545 [Phreatobacter stygius]
MLDDPMILAIMRADGVDPARFRAMLAKLSASLGTSSLADANPAGAKRPGPGLRRSGAAALAETDMAIDRRKGAGPW